MAATPRWALPILISLTCLAAPASAAAFTQESPFSKGCHERITADALALAGWPGGAVAPAPDKPTRVLRDNLIFDPPDGLEDRWALSLLIGARYNDFQGNRPSDFHDLAHHHNDDGGQREHCLRASDQNGRAGDEAALAECRGFILEQVEMALGPHDDLDLGAIVSIEFAMRFERTEVDLNRFAFHVGRALHAIQDSFSHTLRDPDDPRIIYTVFNYIEATFDDDYDRATDGIAHASRFDTCASENSLRSNAAREASAALLSALADPSGGRQGRLDRVNAFLDEYMSLSPTPCTDDNLFCGAFDEHGDLIPALEVPDVSSCGCRTLDSSGYPPLSSSAALALLALSLLGLRRHTRRHRAGLRVVAVGSFLATALVLTTLPQLAAAQDAPPTQPADDEVPSEPELGFVPTEAYGAGPYSVSASVGASLDNGALFGRVGFGWEITREVLFGVIAEYNPWLSLDRLAFSPGAFNGFLTIGYRWLETDLVALHSGLGLGASVLLFDVVSTPAGSVGPFAQLEPVAIVIYPRDRLRVLISPGEFAMPVPNLDGVPFLYRQYRLSIGLQYNP